MTRIALRSVLLLGFCALLAACGGTKRSSGTTSGVAGAQKTLASLEVGLVTDIGGLNDRSFNHLAYVGLQRAESRLHVQGRALTSSSNADYVPNLSSLARQNYDLVIAVGFLMADAVSTVAKKFPQTHFAIIDLPVEALKGKPENVVGLVFKQEQGGYLAGYLAGLIQKQAGFPRSKPQQVVGAVGGQKIPPVVSYIAGYRAGAKAADPQAKVLIQYSNDFVDQAKCKEITLNQIAASADAIIQLAGGCGLGVLDAAREKGVWGIGADADQSYLGAHILTSALKKVDVSVFDTVKSVGNGSFKGGTDSVFDVANGGVGIGKISPQVPKALVAKVMAVKAKLAKNAIKVPTT
ncbi:MAG TPA: BMP family ABC transporter substrate-binding protein [Gaiellaceae bacterium]|nr:BMP family ABC transporter substrate-binding protein [Gaiellaceae bacterium]